MGFRRVVGTRQFQSPGSETNAGSPRMEGGPDGPFSHLQEPNSKSVLLPYGHGSFKGFTPGLQEFQMYPIEDPESPLLRTNPNYPQASPGLTESPQIPAHVPSWTLIELASPGWETPRASFIGRYPEDSYVDASLGYSSREVPREATLKRTRMQSPPPASISDDNEQLRPVEGQQPWHAVSHADRAGSADENSGSSASANNFGAFPDTPGLSEAGLAGQLPHQYFENDSQPGSPTKRPRTSQDIPSTCTTLSYSASRVPALTDSLQTGAASSGSFISDPTSNANVSAIDHACGLPVNETGHPGQPPKSEQGRGLIWMESRDGGGKCDRSTAPGIISQLESTKVRKASNATEDYVGGLSTCPAADDHPYMASGLRMGSEDTDAALCEGESYNKLEELILPGTPTAAGGVDPDCCGNQSAGLGVCCGSKSGAVPDNRARIDRNLIRQQSDTPEPEVIVMATYSNMCDYLPEVMDADGSVRRQEW
jgi:hypothetical protein